MRPSKLSIRQFFRRVIMRKMLILASLLSFMIASGLVYINSKFLQIQTEKFGNQLEVTVKPNLREANFFEAQRQLLLLTKYTSLASGIVVKEPGEVLFSVNRGGRKLSLSEYFVNDSALSNIWKTTVFGSRSFPLFDNNSQKYSIYFEMENYSQVYFLYTTIFFLVLLVFSLILYWQKQLRRFFVKLTYPLIEMEKSLDTYIKTGKFDKDLKVSSLEEYQNLFDKLKSFNEKILSNEEIIKRKSFDEAVGKVSMQLVHDLKSPLSVLEMACKDIENEESRYLAKTSFFRIQNMVEDLLESRRYSCPEQRGEDFFLSEFMSDLNLKWSSLMRDEEELKVEFKYEGERDILLHLPKIGLTRTLENLILNSIEAVSKKGEVLCLFKVVGEELEIEVKDNGPGIPESIRPRILSEEVSYGKEKGNGLGLVQVKTFLDSIDGSIEFISSDLGTVFTLRIPLETKGLEMAQMIHIDDDELVRLAWKIEASRKDIELIQFESFEQFSKRLCEVNLDTFIFIDYQLKGLDGLSAARKLKEKGFKNIYLSTGLPEIEGSHFPQIGKAFPSDIVATF